MDYKTYVELTHEERMTLLSKEHQWFMSAFRLLNLLMIAFTAGFVVSALLDFSKTVLLYLTKILFPSFYKEQRELKK